MWLLEVSQEGGAPEGQHARELLPSFTSTLANLSVPVDRDVTFTCNVEHLGQYKVHSHWALNLSRQWNLGKLDWFVLFASIPHL